MTVQAATIKLNNGREMPATGFGTFGGSHAPPQVYEASKAALEAGYRHFDTAWIYQTEEVLGKAIRESGIPREELFITTKLYQTFHEPQHVIPAFELSLKNLGMDYVDLYLIHWSFAWKFTGYGFDDWKSLQDENGHVEPIDVSFIDTWREMEKLVKDGRAKSIGVSNFTIPMLEELLANCEIPPAVNQIEIHPSLPQEDMIKWCAEHNIALTAYSPIANPGRRGEPPMLQHPAVLEAAKKYNKSPVQVLLNWGLARGYAVIPKSVTPERIKANLERFEMDKEDVEKITAIGREIPRRTCDPAKIWGPKCDVFNTFSQ